MFNLTIIYESSLQLRVSIESETELKDFLRDAGYAMRHPDQPVTFTFTGTVFSSVGLRAVTYTAMPAL